LIQRDPFCFGNGWSIVLTADEGSSFSSSTQRLECKTGSNVLKFNSTANTHLMSVVTSSASTATGPGMDILHHCSHCFHSATSMWDRLKRPEIQPPTLDQLMSVITGDSSTAKRHGFDTLTTASTEQLQCKTDSMFQKFKKVI